MILHFFKPNFICQSSDHLNILSRSDWKKNILVLQTSNSPEDFDIIWKFQDLTINTLLSGIYIHDEQQYAKDWSLWHPTDDLFHSDLHPFNRTLWSRPESYCSIQFSTLPFMPWALIFRTSLLFSRYLIKSLTKVKKIWCIKLFTIIRTVWCNIQEF